MPGHEACTGELDLNNNFSEGRLKVSVQGVEPALRRYLIIPVYLAFYRVGKTAWVLEKKSIQRLSCIKRGAGERTTGVSVGVVINHAGRAVTGLQVLLSSI